MNKKDKEKVRQAIYWLMTDGNDFQRGMKILGDLVGIKFPAIELMLRNDLKSVNVYELLKKEPT